MEETKVFTQEQKTESLRKALIEAGYDMASSQAESMEEDTESFGKIWEGYPHLKDVRAWWNKLEPYFTITPVGKALANAYIRGKEPSIPPMY